MADHGDAPLANAPAEAAGLSMPGAAGLSILTSAPPFSMCSSSAALMRGCVRGLWTVFIQIAVMKNPMPPVTKKTQVQPNRCTIHPESGANRKVAKYWLELKI